MKLIVREADNVVMAAVTDETEVRPQAGQREEVADQTKADFDAAAATAGPTGAVIWDAATRRAVARARTGTDPVPQPKQDRQAVVAYLGKATPTAAETVAALKAVARLVGAGAG